MRFSVMESFEDNDINNHGRKRKAVSPLSNSEEPIIEGSPWNDQKRGAWSQEEDELLKAYVANYGDKKWSSKFEITGLRRSGRSCRIRWVNELQSGLNKDGFSLEEERAILLLHALWGNKWSRIAKALPGRTDGRIKNFWNTRKAKHYRHSLPLYPDNILAAVQMAKTHETQLFHRLSNSNNNPTFHDGIIAKQILNKENPFGGEDPKHTRRILEKIFHEISSYVPQINFNSSFSKLHSIQIDHDEKINNFIPSGFGYDQTKHFSTHNNGFLADTNEQQLFELNHMNSNMLRLNCNDVGTMNILGGMGDVFANDNVVSNLGGYGVSQFNSYGIDANSRNLMDWSAHMGPSGSIKIPGGMGDAFANDNLISDLGDYGVSQFHAYGIDTNSRNLMDWSAHMGPSGSNNVREEGDHNQILHDPHLLNCACPTCRDNEELRRFFSN